MSRERESEMEEHPIAEVDRIRDIIMGPQMRVYEQQFRRIASQLDQLGKQLEELRAALSQKGQELEAQTLKLQQDTQQRDSDLERSFTGQLGQLQSRQEKQGSDLAAQIRDLAADVRNQGQDLRTEFTHSMDALEDDKTSRGHLGDLLVEMGTRLKQQAGLADLLGHVGKGENAPDPGVDTQSGPLDKPAKRTGK